MSSESNKPTRIIARVLFPLALIGVFALGYAFRGVVSTDPGLDQPVATDPSAAPASDPGASNSATDGTTRPPKYACSMFCVPPLPKPGKCPICGMEMVEVDTDGSDDLPPRSLKLSPAAEKLAEIHVAPVQRQFVSAEIRMVGSVAYDETRLGYISAWVPGRLDRLYVDYTGVPVKQGDHLVYLYSPELAAAQTELLEALKRVRELGEQSSAMAAQRARQWLDDIREKFRLWGMTDTQIAEIETRGTASEYMTIYAPSGGIVIDKNAVEGMYVQTGTRIYTIADLSRVWVMLEAYESDLTWLRYGQAVEFESEAWPGEKFDGRIAFIDPVLNTRTRTVKVRVNVDNPAGRLKPGMFVRAVVRAKVAEGGRVVNAELAGKWISPMHPEVVKDAPGNCDVCGMPLVRAESLGFVSVELGDAMPPLVIPASAPLITGQRALVYVALPNRPGVYQGREVQLGPRAGDHYIVRDGLQENEQVVVHGNFKIDSAMQIRAASSMMNPDATSAEDSVAVADSKLPAPRADLDQEQVARIEVDNAAGKKLTALFAEYSRVRIALSKDDHAAAVKATGKLANANDEVDSVLKGEAARRLWAAESPGIRTSTDGIAKSPDIESARMRFASLSESMIVIARRLGAGDTTLHRIHCPMAFDGRGADWLQAGKRVENPFFGAAMYRCGVRVATIDPATIDAATAGQPGNGHD